MPNAADRKSIRRQEKAARLADQQRRDVIVMLMSTSPGRLWLWDRLGDTHIFHTTHVGGNPHESAFQEGRRSVGLALLADIMAYAPDQYIQAMREANERHIADRIADSADADADSADAPSERPSSPLPNGGDSGAIANPADDTDDAGGEAGWNPGQDIYAPRPQG